MVCGLDVLMQTETQPPPPVKIMYPTFAVLCTYFAPLIYISGRLGIASTVLMVSYLENAAMLIKLEERLQTRFDCSLIANVDYEVMPEGNHIESFYEALNETFVCSNEFKADENDIKRQQQAIKFNKSLLIDSMVFRVKSNSALGLSLEEIVTKAYDHQTSTIFDAPYLINGKKADTFGMLRMMEGIFVNSARRFVNEEYDVPEEQIQENAAKILSKRIEKFRATHAEVAQNPYVQDLISVIHQLSTMELKSLGIDIKTYAFHYRNTDSGSSMSRLRFQEIKDLSSPPKDNQGNIPENAAITPVYEFIKFLNKETADERKLFTLGKIADEIFNSPAPTTDLEEFHAWIQADPIEKVKIKDHLLIINNHYSSAKNMFERSPLFAPGMEKAPYPISLALELMKVTNGREFLTELLASADYKHGVKSIMAQDKEEIFIFTYSQDKANGNWDWMNFLIKHEFEFSDIHLKALFRDILNSNDTDFLDFLIEKHILDLFRYQSNRGITFYHSILLDGSTQMIKHVHDKYIIRYPNSKIQFVPCPEITSSASTEYWKAEKEDPFCTGPYENCLKSKMKLRKGHDSLTIAASKGDLATFTCLLQASADCSEFMKLGGFCFDNYSEFDGAIKCREARQL